MGAEAERKSRNSADWSAVPLDSASGHELIRERLAIYGRAMALAGAFFLVANVQVGFFLMGVPASVYVGLLSVKLHALVVAIFGLEWFLSRHARLSPAAYELIDAAS